MALANYTDLVTAVGDYMARSTDTAFTARIADFILQAEAQLSLQPPIRNATIDYPLTGVLSSRNLTLPADFLEPHALSLNAFNVIQDLALQSPETMYYSTVNAIPEQWAINGSLIDLNCPCDSAYSFTLRYKADLALASTNTNWLMTNHPEVYLAAAMAEASVYSMDWQAAQTWSGKFKSAIDGVSWSETRSVALAPLRVDEAIGGEGSFNIYSGD